MSALLNERMNGFQGASAPTPSPTSGRRPLVLAGQPDLILVGVQAATRPTPLPPLSLLWPSHRPT